MRKLTSLILAALASTALGISTMTAQDMNLALIGTHNADWSSDVTPGRKVFILTKAEPTRRRGCRVQSVSPSELLCAHHFGRSATAYQKDAVQALLSPGDTWSRYVGFAGFAGAGGAIIYGAVVLASVTIIGAIPVAIVGGMFVLVSPMAFDNDGTVSESVLYLAPGQDLKVKLHVY